MTPSVGCVRNPAQRVEELWPMRHHCDRYACTDLPPHSHLPVPLPPRGPYSATHLEGPDIDRVYVDWRQVAYEQWTGRRRPGPDGQLTLDDFRQEALGG